MTQNQLWSRWTLTNAFGEMIGLGLTFAITGLFFTNLGEQKTIASILLAFTVAVLSDAVEATIVGLAQWWAMHPWCPSIGRFAWWRATLVGALIAYVLGYLPSTLMSMGTVGGAVLSFAQWLALRDSVQGARLWIPANMLAWLFGMPLIFWGIDLAFKMPLVWQSALVMAGSLFVAGTVVGAIHGLVLVRLAERDRSTPET